MMLWFRPGSWRRGPRGEKKRGKKKGGGGERTEFSDDTRIK